jgi:hypothetical protein
MSQSTGTHSRDQQVRQVTEDLLQQAQPILADIAKLLVDTPDEKLFGATEFALRDKILKLVAVALNARLAEKKVATTEAASTALTATTPPPSTATGPENCSALVVKSPAGEPTTTAAVARKGLRHGTKKSG